MEVVAARAVSATEGRVGVERTLEVFMAGGAPLPFGSGPRSIQIAAVLVGIVASSASPSSNLGVARGGPVLVAVQADLVGENSHGEVLELLEGPQRNMTGYTWLPLFRRVARAGEQLTVACQTVVRRWLRGRARRGPVLWGHPAGGLLGLDDGREQQQRAKRSSEADRAGSTPQGRASSS